MSKAQDILECIMKDQATCKAMQGAQVFKNYFDMPVWQLRHLQVSRFIQKHGIKSILDIGCAEGTLINRLSRSPQITKLIGIDMDSKVLEIAKTNCAPQLMQQDIAYQRKRPLYVELYKLNALEPLPYQKFRGIQLVTMIQFIQHLKKEDLPKICEQVFQLLVPKFIIITTPNRQFNIHFNFKPGQMRHPQHTFQWNRQQFKDFCLSLASKYNYSYEIFGVGEHVSNQQQGFCSQGAFFTSLRQEIDLNYGMQATLIQPQFLVKYPFWKDKINLSIQAQLRNIILRNNFESPENILILFKQSKIGKMIIYQTQQGNESEGKKIEQDNELPEISVEWLIQKVQKIKYCGFNAEYNYLYYQYQQSCSEDDQIDEEGFRRQQNGMVQQSKI